MCEPPIAQEPVRHSEAAGEDKFGKGHVLRLKELVDIARRHAMTRRHCGDRQVDIAGVPRNVSLDHLQAGGARSPTLGNRHRIRMAADRQGDQVMDMR